MVAKYYQDACHAVALRSGAPSRSFSVSVGISRKVTELRRVSATELPAVAGQKPSGQLVLQPESIALFCLDPEMAALAARLSQALPLTGFQPDVQTLEAACREAFATYSVVIFLGPAALSVETLSALVAESPTRPVVLALNNLKTPVVQQWPTGARKASALIHFLTAFAMSG